MLRQLAGFVGISGLGWCLDFALYLCFTLVLGWPVFWANCASGLPAITLVFAVSTHKIFRQGGRLPLAVKYLLYLAYQGLLLAAVSSLAAALVPPLSRLLEGAGALLPMFGNWGYALPAWPSGPAKTLSKLGITPLTMLCNFCVMKLLSERC